MHLYVWEHAGECNFQKIAVIDYCISVIWVRRFQNTGEFELYLPASDDVLKLFTSDRFILITKDEDESCAMIPESVQLMADQEEGDRMIVKGRSAECILEQRIIMNSISLSSATYSQIIEYLVRKCVVDPHGETESLRKMRKIPEISMATTIPDTATANLQEYGYGANLLNSVVSLCQSAGIGFRMQFRKTGFVFQMYSGGESAVIFSPDLDTIGTTTYLYDKSTHYNLIMELGDGNPGYVHPYAIAAGSDSGLYLREKYVKAENLPASDLGTIDEIRAYQELLQQRADDNLKRSQITKEISGENLNTDMYQFGTDYNLGDMVSIMNEYGIEGKAIVTEITEIEDAEGYRLTPTFSDWKVI